MWVIKFNYVFIFANVINNISNLKDKEFFCLIKRENIIMPFDMRIKSYVIKYLLDKYTLVHNLYV